MKKKILAILLAICLIGGITPSMAFAGTITIKDHAGQVIILDNVEISDSIDNIKAKIQGQKGLLPAEQKLLYSGNVLEDGKTLYDYNITSTNGLRLYLLQTAWNDVKDASELNTAISSAASPVAVRLTADITIAGTLEIGKNVILNLSGHVLKYENASGKGSVIKVTSGGKLTLIDSNRTAEHKFTVDSATYGLWTLNEGATGTAGTDYQIVTGGIVTGGIVTGGTGDIYSEGGGLRVEDGGALTLLGGSIVGCTATNGGGVYVNGGSLSLDGGKIIGCAAKENGGGVYFRKGSFDIENGEISNCRAKKGGAICICDEEKPAEDNNIYNINMSGGRIFGCSADESGGGIYIQANNFNMTGGSIANCAAENNGGAICMIKAIVDYPKSCTVGISGGTISGCSAYLGRGIYAANNNGKLILRGGKISNDGSFEDCDVDVYIDICTFTMSDGEVGSIYIRPSEKTNTRVISGGTVHACEIGESDAVVSGGTFYGDVTNYGKILAGMFYGAIKNKTSKLGTGEIDENSVSVRYMDGDELYATQIVRRGGKAMAPIVPAKAGYTFGGWYREECTDKYGFETAVSEDINLYAKWTKKKSGSAQQPTVVAPTNGSITLSSNGRTATITPNEGYEIAKVLLNGVDKGRISELTGLRTGDKIEVIFEKIDKGELDFADVDVAAYYYEAVRWAATNGITTGTHENLFSPNKECTRAEIVTFLWRAAGSPVVNYAMGMDDVPKDAYYAEAVRWALSEGIAAGTGDDTFSPNSACTRAQAVTFIARAENGAQSSAGSAQVSDRDADAASAGSSPFSDVKAGSYYADPIAWAVENGVTDGIGGGLFAPDDGCTRARIVTFLYRAMAK